ncbi:hypothetical protein ACQKWADRAFT_169162 [Trichoderma austrokoningii]
MTRRCFEYLGLWMRSSPNLIIYHPPLWVPSSKQLAATAAKTPTREKQASGGRTTDPSRAQTSKSKRAACRRLWLGLVQSRRSQSPSTGLYWGFALRRIYPYIRLPPSSVTRMCSYECSASTDSYLLASFVQQTTYILKDTVPPSELVWSWLVLLQGIIHRIIADKEKGREYLAKKEYQSLPHTSTRLCICRENLVARLVVHVFAIHGSKMPERWTQLLISLPPPQLQARRYIAD